MVTSKADRRTIVVEAKSVGRVAPGETRRRASAEPRILVEDVSLDVRSGEVLAIVGPSGCGKTLFLGMIAGFEPKSYGTLSVWGERPQTGHPAVGFAFARDALLPWRTARENVALALELRGVGKRERLARADAVLDRVGLTGSRHAYRAELSQGMRQRVALARTFVTEPRLLLLDEPFAALDAQTRLAMQDLLLSLLDDFQGTVVLVTHDLREAIAVADRVILFTRGPARVKSTHQIDLPRPRRAADLEEQDNFHTTYHDLRMGLAEEVL